MAAAAGPPGRQRRGSGLLARWFRGLRCGTTAAAPGQRQRQREAGQPQRRSAGVADDAAAEEAVLRGGGRGRPRLSLSMVWRRRRYSSVRPAAASAAAAPSFSPTEESELEPFLGAGAGGEVEQRARRAASTTGGAARHCGERERERGGRLEFAEEGGRPAAGRRPSLALTRRPEREAARGPGCGGRCGSRGALVGGGGGAGGIGGWRLTARTHRAASGGRVG